MQRVYNFIININNMLDYWFMPAQVWNIGRKVQKPNNSKILSFDGVFDIMK